MLEILEKERQKIAIYLHDEVLQSLIAIFHMEKDLNISERLLSIVDEIRNISHDLYPTIVEDLGVEEAIRVFVDDMNNDYNIEIDYDYEYSRKILPKEVSFALYRTVRELVTNAIKYAECTKIHIQVHDYLEGVQCAVKDNGKGFENIEGEKLLKNKHMGLYTTQKQINDLNGNMVVRTDKTGSRIVVYIPVR